MEGKQILDLDEELAKTDPEVATLIYCEEQRQSSKIILIPSESLCPLAVREALSSVYTNIYAEGYPSNRLCKREREFVLEYERYLAFYQRYGNRRYYKGTEFIDLIETLAQERVADLFSTPEFPKERIYANVQPLSGAAANNAVYNAFLKPGDKVMGLSLSHGGHLTHGSPFNRSGRLYNVLSYTTDPKTGKINYDELYRLAMEFQPKIIIAGASAYPWDFDWRKIKEIAREVPVCQQDGRKGAIVVADIAHTAGLVVAGLYPNPVGIADVVTFTTHKTLCGPRGAVILSTDEWIAKQIDSGVFPGEQGGPHINNIAAKAVCFKIAKTEEFKKLQKRIVDNAKYLAEALTSKGIKLVYGGTNTHMLLIDLNAIEKKSGVKLRGDIVSNILDNCGIVCNKNTIPGDTNAVRPSGLRLGTVIPSQLGMGKEEMYEIADLICKVLFNLQTFSISRADSIISRARLDFDVKREVRSRVKALIEKFSPNYDNTSSYKEIAYLKITSPRLKIIETLKMKEKLHCLDFLDFIEITGERAMEFLQTTLTSNVANLSASSNEAFSKRWQVAYLLNSQPNHLEKLAVIRLNDFLDNRKNILPQKRYLLVVRKEAKETIKLWLTSLSNGYIIFDRYDIYAKIYGPVCVKELTNLATEEMALVKYVLTEVTRLNLFSKTPRTRSELDFFKEETLESIQLNKTFFIGQKDLALDPMIRPFLNEFARDKKEFQEPKSTEIKKTVFYEEHLKLAGKSQMAPFAGWLMPLWYTKPHLEHTAVREKVGLFDVSHMGILKVEGEYATQFLDIVTTNYVAKLRPGQAHYSYVLSPDGSVLDDIIVYRLEPNSYMIVVNAVNTEKIKAWFNAVNNREVIIDRNNPFKAIEKSVVITDLKDKNTPPEWRKVNIALQGPNSLPLLQELVGSTKDRERLAAIKKFHFEEVTLLNNLKIIAARTGYTGEDIGFEIFINENDAIKLWNLLLDRGKNFGIQPCGLAARDSLRIEAGFPLYGHELAGDADIIPTAVGYAANIKLHKPFFIGKDKYIEKEAKIDKQIIRYKILAKDSKIPREHSLIIAKNGTCIGYTTSGALCGSVIIGLGYVNKNYLERIKNTPVNEQEKASTEWREIGILILPKAQKLYKDPWSIKEGDKVVTPIPALIINRFFNKQEEYNKV